MVLPPMKRLVQVVHRAPPREVGPAVDRQARHRRDVVREEGAGRLLGGVLGHLPVVLRVDVAELCVERLGRELPSERAGQAALCRGLEAAVALAAVGHEGVGAVGVGARAFDVEQGAGQQHAPAGEPAQADFLLLAHAGRHVGVLVGGAGGCDFAFLDALRVRHVAHQVGRELVAERRQRRGLAHVEGDQRDRGARALRALEVRMARTDHQLPLRREGDAVECVKAQFLAVLRPGGGPGRAARSAAGSR